MSMNTEDLSLVCKQGNMLKNGAQPDISKPCTVLPLNSLILNIYPNVLVLLYPLNFVLRWYGSLYLCTYFDNQDKISLNASSLITKI